MRVQLASEAQRIAGCAKRVDSSTRGKGVFTDELDCRVEQIGTHCGHEGAHILGLAALSREQDGSGAGIEHTLTVAADP